MKTHAMKSYEIIVDRWDISPEVKAAVLFHHENVDGKRISAWNRWFKADDLY